MFATAQTAAAAFRPEPNASPFGRAETVLDAFFYDVGALSAEERASLAAGDYPEGTLLSVAPKGGPIAPMMPGDAGRGIDTVVVAGVGRSALGAAAFARNVADAQRAPVIAVVSGRGAADVMQDAMGGWFWRQALRHTFRREEPTPEAGSMMVEQLPADTQALFALLKRRAGGIRRLVGHSKGNRCIAEALFALLREAPDKARAIGGHAQVVTISAMVMMPGAMGRVVDVMGAIDQFGWLHSDPRLTPDVLVPGAWHHTNTEWAGCLAVRPVLEAVLG